MRIVKIALGVLGGLMLLIGCLWIAQGMGLSFPPGSFMIGDVGWSYRGAAVAVIGAALLFWTTRRSAR